VATRRSLPPFPKSQSVRHLQEERKERKKEKRRRRGREEKRREEKRREEKRREEKRREEKRREKNLHVIILEAQHTNIWLFVRTRVLLAELFKHGKPSR